MSPGDPMPPGPSRALTAGFSADICAACHIGDHLHCTGSEVRPCQCGHYQRAIK